MREVIFEIKQYGHIVKVTAVDVATGTEVSVQGPATTPQHDLQQLALRKLEYVMKKSSHDRA